MIQVRATYAVMECTGLVHICTVALQNNYDDMVNIKIDNVTLKDNCLQGESLKYHLTILVFSWLLQILIFF